ncbi:hypothetical protein DSM104635_01781 [Terricaulis silvestris]|uniref:Uncharacterized protein n=2 Tax=Terricaulis silvestris TaxID=2686094 RepID=A0A6I6MNN9_9CAUL|nr:hypothetical protein DSM104635_01781 [Terricaulis silvestris]
MGEAIMPPKALTIARHAFSEIFDYTASVDLTTEGGRASNRDLPFFFLHNAPLEEGFFFGFGWSGQWEAAVVRDPRAVKRTQAVAYAIYTRAINLEDIFGA